MSTRRKLFYGFTAMVIALLLVLPTTGWLARLQLIPVFSGGKAGLTYLAASLQWKPDVANHSTRSFVEQYPNDFDLQYAYALSAGSSEALRRLDALSKHFPNDPRILAAQLRYWTNADHSVKIDQPELENLPHPVPASKTDAVKPPVTPQDPATLAAYDATAAAGERAEPNNAFFPAMRAVGYFAAHRNADAIIAWKRAGTEPIWNEHISDEMQAREHLMRALHGGSEAGSFARMSVWAGMLFPHYTSLRTATRVAIGTAIQSELAGNTEEGFEIRRATRAIGEHMQAQSSAYIGNLVGIAIGTISSSRPGGAPAIEIPKGGPNDWTLPFEQQDVRFRPRWDAYTSYLNRIGHPEEAAAFMAAHEECNRLRDIGKIGLKNSYLGFGDKMQRLIAYWVGDILLISGALCSLAFCGVFALVYRFSPRIQQGEPMQSSAKWGVLLAFALPVIVTLTLTVVAKLPDGIAAAIGMFQIVALIASPYLMRLSLKQVGHGLLVMIATFSSVVAIVGVGAIGALLFAGSTGVSALYQSLTSADGSGGDLMMNHASLTRLPIVAGATMTLLPLVMLAVFALFSAMLRVPVTAGVTRGMRAMSVPLACVLLLGWGVCLLGTLRHENAAIAEMDRAEKFGEMAMYASIVGTAPEIGKTTAGRK